MARLTVRRLVGLLAIAVVGTACTPGAEVAPDATPTPTRSPEKKEPRVAIFRTGFNVVEATGVSCRGLAGPWRVRIEPPEEIGGRGRATFRLENGRGPARLRWSFEASHPIQGLVTYSGDVTVRAFRSTTGTELRFSGTQTSVGAESQVIGSARVRFGGPCPEKP